MLLPTEAVLPEWPLLPAEVTAALQPEEIHGW
jgi:hypothetical protein